MISRPRSFPHPVLSPLSDDVSPNNFDLSLSISSDADNFYLDASFSYENATLSELSSAGIVSHALHLECKRNFYREVFRFPANKGRVTVSASELRGTIEVSAFLIADADIQNYAVAGSHADYRDYRFEIKSGDVLAVAPSLQFDAFVDYDPLRNLSSILDIRRGESEAEGKMDVFFDEDRIVVRLTRPDFDRYRELKADPSVSPLLANQIGIPALLEALHFVKDTEVDDWETQMERRWFRSIVKKLEEAEIDMRSNSSNALDALQHLLRFPLRRSLENISRINPLETEL